MPDVDRLLNCFGLNEDIASVRAEFSNRWPIVLILPNKSSRDMPS
jgi:hypothetical protein